MEIPPFACQNICFLQAAAPNLPTLPDTPGQCAADPAQHRPGWALLCLPCRPPGSPKSHNSSGGNKPTKPRAQSSSCPVPMALSHSGTQPSPHSLSPGEQTSHQRQGPGAACQRRGQLAIAKDLTDLPWPWAVLRNLLHCPKPSAESCAAVLSVTRSPSENQQLHPIRSFGDKFSSKRI